MLGAFVRYSCFHKQFIWAIHFLVRLSVPILLLQYLYKMSNFAMAIGLNGWESKSVLHPTFKSESKSIGFCSGYEQIHDLNLNPTNLIRGKGKEKKNQHQLL